MLRGFFMDTFNCTQCFDRIAGNGSTSLTMTALDLFSIRGARRPSSLMPYISNCHLEGDPLKANRLRDPPQI